MKRKFWLVGGAIWLAGCATAPQWVNSKIPQEEWGRDLSRCRRNAEVEVSRRIGYDRRSTEDPFSGPAGDGERYQARKLLDREVASCMTDLGYYRPTK
jgi:hypothetical protein